MQGLYRGYVVELLGYTQGVAFDYGSNGPSRLDSASIAKWQADLGCGGSSGLDLWGSGCLMDLSLQRLGRSTAQAYGGKMGVSRMLDVARCSDAHRAEMQAGHLGFYLVTWKFLWHYYASWRPLGS